MLARILACAVVTLSLVGTGATEPQLPSAATQTSGIKRIPLQKFDVPGTQYETITAVAEVAPNSAVGRHTHFGPETGYVIEGDIVMIMDGQPERTLRAGESYYVPAGTVHDGKAGPKGAKIIAIYVVEKGKPLATPAK